MAPCLCSQAQASTNTGIAATNKHRPVTETAIPNASEKPRDRDSKLVLSIVDLAGCVQEIDLGLSIMLRRIIYIVVRQLVIVPSKVVFGNILAIRSLL